MKLTKEQAQEIKDLQSQENKTKRVVAPELEKILYDAISVLDHGFIRVIDYITLATTGNVQDFGDLDNGSTFNHTKGDLGACSSPTRCVMGGSGQGSPGTCGMQFVEIATTGNGVDFGALTVGDDAVQDPGMWSTGHGGL